MNNNLFMVVQQSELCGGSVWLETKVSQLFLVKVPDVVMVHPWSVMNFGHC